MNKESIQTETIHRRSFLKGAAVATTAIGAGAAVGIAQAESVEDAPVKNQKKGYRETPHIREYYRLARL
ncbi:MAG: twin-arginine translocation signal domain-containing protein [Gammaproteobacteria bacterium]|nr:twin-arginine translocation signal domain-containing protein [Gammaproteobacteria bacterium]MCY4218171.1 twin-arginine translocation signal domain-containing protein [Gammaproteobacteria bacterium]MCY4274447.1 twin-arginine translocation signal domain-containing protein [Gammaproteobacteria bacterium]